MADEPELDAFARAGITDADFEDDAPVVEAQFEETPEAPEAVEEAPSGPARDEHGRFAPKAATEAPAAPQAAPEAAPEPAAPPADLNLPPEAREAWAAVPAAVRDTVTRRVSELQGGIEKYRTQIEPVRPFLERAGSPEALAQALNAYVSAEDMLRQDPIRGLDSLCQSLGTTLRDVAAHVMGQPAPEKDAVIDGLRRELQALQSQVGTVTKTFEQQRREAAEATVTSFAAEHPRFEELAEEIGRMLRTGYIDPASPDALKRAYEIADRANPAPQPAAAPVAAPVAVQARTPAANLSVSGTPSAGSNLSVRTPPANRRENIAQILDQVGL